MRKFIGGASILLALAGPAHAWGDPPAPPAPTATAAAAAVAVQGQAQGQQQSIRNSVSNSATANGGAGGAGGAGGHGGAGGLGGTGNGGAGGTGVGGGGGVGNGGNQTQGQSTNNSGVGANSNNYQQSGIPASTATAPSYAIGQCMFAVSGGLQFFGSGFSGGTAGMYEFCKDIYKAQYFRSVGRQDVAQALECKNSDFREAYKGTTTPCAQDAPKQAMAIPTPASQGVIVTSVAGQTPMVFASRADCIASLNATGGATRTAIAACPQN